MQLLALAMAALEQQVAALPDAAAAASQAEWRAVVSALLASCSVAAARAWLGYVPEELQRQAAAAVQPLRAGPPAAALAPVPCRPRKCRKARTAAQAVHPPVPIITAAVMHPCSAATAGLAPPEMSGLDQQPARSSEAEPSGSDRSGSAASQAVGRDAALWAPARQCDRLHAGVVRCRD